MLVGSQPLGTSAKPPLKCGKPTGPHQTTGLGPPITRRQRPMPNSDTVDNVATLRAVPPSPPSPTPLTCPRQSRATSGPLAPAAATPTSAGRAPPQGRCGQQAHAQSGRVPNSRPDAGLGPAAGGERGVARVPRSRYGPHRERQRAGGRRNGPLLFLFPRLARARLGDGLAPALAWGGAR